MLVEEFNNCIYVGINNNLDDKKNQWIIFKKIKSTTVDQMEDGSSLTSVISVIAN